MIKNSFFADEKSVVFLFINGPHHVYHAIIPALTFAKNNPDRVLHKKLFPISPKMMMMEAESDKTEKGK